MDEIGKLLEGVGAVLVGLATLATAILSNKKKD